MTHISQLPLPPLPRPDLHEGQLVIIEHEFWKYKLMCDFAFSVHKISIFLLAFYYIH